MESLWQTIRTMVWNVFHRPGLADIIDIIVVAFVIYELIMLTRQTRGSAVLKGLVLLLVIVGVSNLLGLTALNWLLMNIIANGAVVLVGLFQPELRKALEQMGAMEMTALLDRVRAKFPRNRIPKTLDSIQNTMDRMEEKGVDFEAEDDCYYGGAEKELLAKLTAYVRENGKHFR